MVIIPGNKAYVIKRGGNYQSDLRFGFHVLNPLFERASDVFVLDEQTITVPAMPSNSIAAMDLTLKVQIHCTFIYYW
jgi:GTP:adenosylcobinamide-phosphate guanylyltransferase